MIIASIVLYKHDYNALEQTLDCLIKNKYISKIILIDNDSSNWANNSINKKIIYIKSPGNIGFGSAHNIAINTYADQSNYFLICNPDIYFEQEQFNIFIDFVLKNKAGLYLPKVIYPDGTNQYAARLLPSFLNLFARRFSRHFSSILDKKYLLQQYEMNQPCFIPYLSGCFMLFDSNALKSLKGFDERYFMYMEDIDLSRRCANSFENLYYPNATIIHKHEQASYKNRTLLIAHLRSAFQYFNKWGWFFDKTRFKLNKRTIKALKIR